MSENNKKTFSRRTFLASLSAMAGAAVCPSVLSADDNGFSLIKQEITPDQALELLMEGNERYLHNETHRHDFHIDREILMQGQLPIAAVISCSDSRVVPQFAFDQGPGKLFVVRVAGNIANSQGVASIEYTVNYLHTPLVFVLGHTYCGAVSAAIKAVKGEADLPGELPGLVSSIARAVHHAKSQPGDLITNTVYENVKLTVKKLKDSSLIIHSKVESKEIKVVGGVYDLATGQISLIT